MAKLPTADQMLNNADADLMRALSALSDAAAELRSDWTPVGSALTDHQAARRLAMRTAIAIAKGAIRDAREGRDVGVAPDDN
jgi:hypothetical protein